MKFPWFRRRSRLKLWIVDVRRTTEAAYTISSPGACDSGKLKKKGKILRYYANTFHLDTSKTNEGISLKTYI